MFFLLVYNLQICYSYKSMLEINIQNVEELIFQNNKIWRDLPDMAYLRDHWRMSKISPIFKAMGKKAILDFLNKVSKDHEKIISKHLGTSVSITKIDRHLIKNMEIKIDEAEDILNLFSDELYPYFSTYRKEDNVYVTFWR